MKQFGLIGKPLTHSFSASYFTEKFRSEGIHDCRYDKFELDSIEDFDALITDKNPVGLNVTIPYKEAVIPLLHRLDSSAEKVGAVNVIKRVDQELIGYNSDYYGFRQSLETWLPHLDLEALVLGSGGASKAVIAALRDLQIPYKLISRGSSGDLTYQTLEKSVAASHHLWINTTPLGMRPNVQSAPDLPYDVLGPDHFLYDLVYNPETTQFMKYGKSRHSKTKNGLEMLYLQAERSWQIWNSEA
jgi:shikimate dehydrogenase